MDFDREQPIMQHISIDEAPTGDFGAGVDFRTLTGPLESTEMSIHRFRLDPQSSPPWGLHAHFDQEEVFIVTEGSVTFETFDGLVTVMAGDAIQFESGEYQAIRNDGSDSSTYLAIGAPADSTDIRVPLPCLDCNREELRIEVDTGELACVACDFRQDPRCELCGADEREVRLNREGSELIDRCRGCGSQTGVRPLT